MTQRGDSDPPTWWDPYVDDDDELQGERADECFREFALLHSEVSGLYSEFDKLAKKQPSAQISELALKRVNKAIGDAKSFLGGDRYVDETEIFIPAGENPTNSDVLLVLSSLKSGLIRLKGCWEAVWDEMEIISSYSLAKYD